MCSFEEFTYAGSKSLLPTVARLSSMTIPATNSSSDILGSIELEEDVEDDD